MFHFALAHITSISHPWFQSCNRKSVVCISCNNINNALLSWHQLANRPGQTGYVLTHCSLVMVYSEWQRSRSTLVQVMACCLTAPNHYLNQCGLIIKCVHTRAISYEILTRSVYKVTLKSIFLNLLPHFPGANELSTAMTGMVLP